MRIFELPEPSTLPGPEFAIGEDKFQCRSTLAAGTITNLFYATQSSDVSLRATGLIRVIEAALDDESRDRFDTLIFSPDVNIPLGLLSEIATWLVEEYSGRPSRPSSGSQVGLKPTTATSEDGSSEKASA